MNDVYGAEELAAADEYYLVRFVLGSSCKVAINADVAAALRAAMSDLFEMVDVEQKFDIVMENFLELETEMTTRLLKQAYRSDNSAQEFWADKLAFNRRIINVLTATRLYIDQTTHHIGVFFPKEKTAKAAELKALFSHEYDSVLAYRVMEALRNFSQHRGLPLQGMTHQSSWIDIAAEGAAADDDSYLQYNVALNLVVADLEGEGGLKKAVLKELKLKGDRIDVKKMIREYVEALARVHVGLRDMLKPRIAAADALISYWIDRYLAECGEQVGSAGLGIGIARPNGAFEKIASVHTGPIDSIQALRSRTSGLAKLSKRTVTTKPITPKKKR
jgi:hypothetical protein